MAEPGTVVVVGSINLDESLRVAALPRPGQTTIASSTSSALGGKGANQAVAAARAGGAVRLVGAVGQDDGEPALRGLAAEGIDTSRIHPTTVAATGRAVVLVDDAGENSIVIVGGANGHIDQDHLDRALHDLTSRDTVLLQGEVPPDVNRRAAATARRHGAHVIWNAAPAPRSHSDLPAEIDLVVVNEEELQALAVLVDPTGAGDDALDTVSTAHGADVICTLGARGALYHFQGRRGHLPARAVDPVDTTAAGDTFVGYLAAASTLPWPRRLRRALDAATIAVTRPGASTSIPYLHELTRASRPTRPDDPSSPTDQPRPPQSEETP